MLQHNFTVQLIFCNINIYMSTLVYIIEICWKCAQVHEGDDMLVQVRHFQSCLAHSAQQCKCTYIRHKQSNQIWQINKQKWQRNEMTHIISLCSYKRLWCINVRSEWSKKILIQFPCFFRIQWRKMNGWHILNRSR